MSDAAVTPSSTTLRRIEQARVIAIVRGVALENTRPVLSALRDGGIAAVEIALNSEDALAAVRVASEEYGDAFVVGAGTALDSETARSAILAGADYLLSPVTSAEVIETCCRYSKLAVPGVFSPTEALQAQELGCPLVKVFPAAVLGPEYLEVLRDSLPQVHLMPVGGIALHNVDAFFDAGALAVGVGSQLVNPRWVAAGELHRITETARSFARKPRERLPSGLSAELMG